MDLQISAVKIKPYLAQVGWL